MSLFYSTDERERLTQARKHSPINAFYWTLASRVERRACTPGLTSRGTTTDWWHFISEYLTDAALFHAIKPSPTVDAWLRDAALSVARRPVDDWVGPAFRNHRVQPPLGHLETAHLSWALAITLDLAPDIFTEQEKEELRVTLREKAITLCLHWLDKNTNCHNWRCILLGGIAVAAAVLDDEETLQRALREYEMCVDFFQPDGSYGESLQYGGYALYGLILTREALLRARPAWESRLTVEPWVRSSVWNAFSLFYKKPLSEWGAQSMPRSANFGDSGAVFRPSADILMVIAARAGASHPREAGVARWLFDELYLPCTESGHHDRASFGFVNDYGFLTFLLWPFSADPLSPGQAALSLVDGFGCGDAFARDSWDGRTIIAARTGSAPLHAQAHRHGDVNSFILVHNRERLLVDPGHSCYRNLFRPLDVGTSSHNSCTFHVASSAGAGGERFQEELPELPLQQKTPSARPLDLDTMRTASPLPPCGERLLLARVGDISVIGSEAASVYGAPITSFRRFWFLCGSEAVFVVDHIESTVPVKTTWHWLLNNRDGLLDLKRMPDRIIARRGNAGMKLFHMAGNILSLPVYAYVHDAYHPLPAQLGEGRPGSGMLVHWRDSEAVTRRDAVHAICLGDPGTVAGWHLKSESGFVAVLESPGAKEVWKIRTDDTSITVVESVSGRQCIVCPDGSGHWKATA